MNGDQFEDYGRIGMVLSHAMVTWIWKIYKICKLDIAWQSASLTASLGRGLTPGLIPPLWEGAKDVMLRHGDGHARALLIFVAFCSSYDLLQGKLHAIAFAYAACLQFGCALQLTSWFERICSIINRPQIQKTAWNYDDWQTARERGTRPHHTHTQVEIWCGSGVGGRWNLSSRPILARVL